MVKRTSTKQESLAQRNFFLEDEKFWHYQEEIEFLRETIESLKLELIYTNEQLQEFEEELRDTNEELGTALISLAHLTLEEAQKLAQKLLASQKPTKECLAELLSAIYDSPVELRVLDPSQGRSPLKIHNSAKPEIKSFALEINPVPHEFDKLKTQFFEHQVLVTKLAVQCDKLKSNFHRKTESETK